MWHDESAATNASSGSTPAGSDIGSFTTLGAGDPRTTAPPSNSQRWARLYLLSTKGWSPRSQRTVAMCLPDMDGKSGGEGGIRTHGTASRTPDFESGPFDRSGTSP